MLEFVTNRSISSIVYGMIPSVFVQSRSFSRINRRVFYVNNQWFFKMLYPVVVLILLCSGFTGTRNHVSASSAVRFTQIDLPATGDDGGWVLAPGSDIVKMISAGDGRMYAAVSGLAENLFVTEDNGNTWRPTGDVHHEIIDIAVLQDDPKTVVYATGMNVYQSSDAGETFIPLLSGPGGAGTGNRVITKLDITWSDGCIIAIGVNDEDTGEFGGVYVFDERELIPAWEDTGLTGYDVLNVSFSPGYHADRHVIAAVTDELDTYLFFRQEGSGWNEQTGVALLHTGFAPSDAVAARSACLAFPNDFIVDPCSWQGHFYVGVSTGTGGGDVFRIECGDGNGSSVTDLDIGLARGLPGIDIGCLDAGGPSSETRLIAGSASGTGIFYSPDNGSTWQESEKEPAGSSVVSVVSSVTDDRYFSATSGNGSGVAVSRDAVTWNQVGLIDAKLDIIVDFAPSPAYDTYATLFLLTWGAGSSLWKSCDGGVRWERILWPGITGVTSFGLIALVPEFGTGSETLFCSGEIDGIPGILVSADAGGNFRFRPATDPETGAWFSVDAWAVVDEKTLLIAGYNGDKAMLYRTENAGFTYSPGIEVGDLPLTSLALSPDFRNDGAMLAGTAAGTVLFGSDTERFHRVTDKNGQAPFTGTVYPVFDAHYPDNGYIYAAGGSSGEGIYRYNLSAGAEWESIDATFPDEAAFDRLTCSNVGTMYGANMADGGGLERCLTPGAATSEFDTFMRGLEDDANLFGLWVSGNHVWTTDASFRLLQFDDSLTGQIVPVSPRDGLTGCGTILDHAARNIELDWETMPGATEYQWQCDENNDFKDIPAGLEGKTEASTVRLPALEPGITYYWRVRACSPVYSQWSESLCFSTVLDIRETTLKPESPVPGAADVPVQPLFQWTAAQTATAYELLVSRDVGFSSLSVARTGDYGLPANVWQCDIELEKGATYYWKVRACTSDTFSSWSSTGIFTTVSGTETELDPEGTLASISVASPVVTSAAPVVLPSVINQPTQTVIVPSISVDIPEWFLYGMGGLLGVIFLTLLVILAVILKSRYR